MRHFPHSPAHLVEFVDRRGRVLRRGIFSEATPTVIDLRVLRTRCLNIVRSRFSYARAARALRRLCDAQRVRLFGDARYDARNA